jgi:hypothetical protein
MGLAASGRRTRFATRDRPALGLRNGTARAARENLGGTEVCRRLRKPLICHPGANFLAKVSEFEKSGVGGLDSQGEALPRASNDEGFQMSTPLAHLASGPAEKEFRQYFFAPVAHSTSSPAACAIAV